MPMAVAEQFWVICRTNCTFNRKRKGGKQDVFLHVSKDVIEVLAYVDSDPKC